MQHNICSNQYFVKGKSSIMLTIKSKIYIILKGEESGSGRLLSQDSDSDDDIADELKQDYVDEQTGESPVLV